MLINIITILIMMMSFWAMGKCIVNRVIKLSDSYYYVYMIVGYALTAVLSSFLYFRVGLSIKIIASIILVVSVVVLALQIKNISKNELIHLVIQLFIFAVLIIPGLIYKDQYYVYRGNFFDHYIYMSEGLTAYKFRWPEVVAMGTSAPNDVYQFGVMLLNEVRPPITLVYALLLSSMKGNMFFLAYLYHVMFLSMVFAPMFEMVKHITNNKYISGIITILYIGGFWGQIQFDINAWSHLGTIALFISNAYILMLFFEDAYANKDELVNAKKYVCNIKLLILMNIIMIGGILYYAENWLVQYGLSCMTILLICLVKKFKVSVKQIGSVLTIPVVSIVTSIAVCPQIIDFLKQQVTSSIDTKVDYGPYWYNWLFGFWYKDSIPGWAKIPAIFVSIFGGSVYVPDWNKRRILVLIWTAVFMVIAIVLFINLSARLYHIVKAKDEDVSAQFMSVLFLVSLIAGVVLYYKSGRYSFTKYLLYVSPYLWIVSTISIADFLYRKKRDLITFISCISAVTILFSGITLMGFRVRDTIKNDKCYGYINSYPSDQDPGLKYSHVFNLDVNKTGEAKVVQIEEEFPFYLYYMKLSLLYSGREYYSNENHVFYAVEDVPMIKPNQIDALITLEENAEGRMEPVYR